MKYLTKSRFKLGLECPTKIFYNIHSNVYHDEKLDNDFLQALAKGGFQVGELAKSYYKGLPGVHSYDIDTLDEQEAVSRTETALQEEEEVVIFEAAIRVGSKYIRVDILHKSKNTIRILEVKSKSGEGKDPNQFFGANGGVDSEWRPYLEDIVFQKLVMEQYLKKKAIELPVRAFLMVPDKKKEASIDGLHQKFILVENNGRHSCESLQGLRAEDLGDKILSEILVSDDTAYRLMNEDNYNGDKYPVKGFQNIIDHFEQLVKHYNGNPDVVNVEYSTPGKKCKECTFRTKLNIPTDEGKISGFRQCMEKQNEWNLEEINEPKVYDVWNLSSDSLISKGKWFMRQLVMADFDSKNEPCTVSELGSGLTNVQRRWVQVDRTNKGEGEFVDKEKLRNLMKECKPPYHFIDFETIGPAIPFFKKYSPFQGFAFQFSHHVLDEDDTLQHKTEYLGEGQGVNPFDDFILNLYEALRHDDGTIFMYSSHENTFINNAIVYLLNGQSRFDKDLIEELVLFYKSISKPTSKNSKKDFVWSKGDRMMVDLCELVKKTYWHPIMGGSNSIKKVLPAVLNASVSLQEKYSQPIYGGNDISSFNFLEKTWVEYAEDGSVKDPYELLPGLRDIFEVEMQEIDALLADEKIGNGGAAMTAWSYMQFVHMSDVERRAIVEALKMYCELDTLAMVMIWEYFQSLTAS